MRSVEEKTDHLEELDDEIYRYEEWVKTQAFSSWPAFHEYATLAQYQLLLRYLAPLLRLALFISRLIEQLEDKKLKLETQMDTSLKNVEVGLLHFLQGGGRSLH